MPKTISSISFLFFLLFVAPTSALASGDIVCPSFNEILGPVGIQSDQDFQVSYASSLQKLLTEELAVIKNEMTSDLTSKDRLEELAFQETMNLQAQKLLAPALQSETAFGSKANSYFKSLRARYTICGQENVGRKASLLSYLSARKKKMIWNFNPAYERIVDADLEAWGLINSKGQHSTPKDYIGLTVAQLADLDIGSDHIMWHTNDHMKSLKLRSIDPWKRLEAQAEQAITYKLRLKNPQAAPYKISEARRVLFFNGFKTTATSPKIKVKDRFGINWKVKWGTEIQTEPVANRLYVRLGGKYADIIYSNVSGEKGMVLILDKKDDGCKSVSQTEGFIECMLDSRYKADIEPYIEEAGAITLENQHRLLKGFIDADKAKLIGRNFITFKESSIELNADSFALRGSPTAISSAGNEKDRVTRGIGLFNEWIKNYDVKDENSKSFIVTHVDENYQKTGESYVESQHDMGAAFGRKAIISGRPGSFSYMLLGDKFLNYDNGSLTSLQRVLYRPFSWDVATSSDLLWMARKIVKLSAEEIRADIDSANWPDFIADAWAYRMLARRDHIAKIFNIEELLPQKAPSAPSFGISLTTRADREAAALKTGVSLQNLEFALMHTKKLSKSDLAGNLHRPYVDQVVADGRVEECNKSYLIGLMEENVYPTGLSRRVVRQRDSELLPLCFPGFKEERRSDRRD